MNLHLFTNNFPRNTSATVPCSQRSRRECGKQVRKIFSSKKRVCSKIIKYEKEFETDKRYIESTLQIASKEK